MKDNVRVYIAVHKPSVLPHVQEGYCPIQVGAAFHDPFLLLRDDIGENISCKNDRYCELTALYWAWKHDFDSEYIGLCHYRRYFSFRHDIPFFSYIQKYLKHYSKAFPYERKARIDSVSAAHILKTYDFILPKPFHAESTVKEQYIQGHSEHDLSVLHQVITKLYPEYDTAWDTVMNDSDFSLCNMFITRKQIFEDYMEWLFHILFDTENLISPKEDPYQNRTFGFMAERLLNVYVVHHRYRVKYLHVLFVPEKYDR